MHAHDNGFAGITTDGGHDGLPRTRNLYIADCLAEDNPGDPKNLTNHSGNGIVVGGVDGALIEYCEARNNGWDMPRRRQRPGRHLGLGLRPADHPALHLPRQQESRRGRRRLRLRWRRDQLGDAVQPVLQQPGLRLSALPVSRRPVLEKQHRPVQYQHRRRREELAQRDRPLDRRPGISDALIYNNTIVNPSHAVSTLGDLPGMVYRNNVFVAGGGLLVGDFTHSRFENNLYWSTGQGAFTVTATPSTPRWWSGRRRLAGETGRRSAWTECRPENSSADGPTEIADRSPQARADAVLQAAAGFSCNWSRDGAS